MIKAGDESPTQRRIIRIVKSRNPLDTYLDDPVVVAKYLDQATIVTTLRSGATTLLRTWPDHSDAFCHLHELGEVPNSLIVILREPLDRVRSALNLIAGRTAYKDIRKCSGMFMSHAGPWLAKFEALDLDFRYIRFDRLHEYFPDRHGFDPIEGDLSYELVNVPRREFWLEDVAAYNRLLENNEELNPTEFARLTGMVNH